MGKSYARRNRKGELTGGWVSMYVDALGRLRSVGGKYTSKTDADAAWRAMEAKVKEGTAIDPDKGKMLFRDFVEKVYVPLFEHEKNTLRGYKSVLKNTLLPTLGNVPMSSFTANPEIIKKWIAKDKTRRNVRTGKPVSRYSTQNGFVCLSSVLEHARASNYISFNPCHGMKPFKKGTLKTKQRKLSRDKFAPLIEYVQDRFGSETRLLVNTAYGTGARWSEVIALAAEDVRRDAVGSPYIYIGKAVVYVGPEGEGGNCYEFRNYTKHGEEDQGRRVPISKYLYRELIEHMQANGLRGTDKLFAQERVEAERIAAFQKDLDAVPSLEVMPEMPPKLAENGRYYHHGTTQCYDIAKCRECKWCRAAKARYRAERRAQGLDLHERLGDSRSRNIDGWVSYSWFSKNVWSAARKATNMTDEDSTFHKLRHAYISYMLNVKGVHVAVMMDRAGHKRLETTQRYHHEDEVVDTSGIDDEPIMRRAAPKVVGLEDFADLPEDDDI